MVTAIIIAALTGLCVCLSVVLKPEIALGKIKIGTYWLIALVGAIAVLISGVLPLNEAFAGLTQEGAINPLKILALFITMTFLSVFLDELGFFEFLAEKVLEKSGKSQLKLFALLYVAVSILTVFTSNDVIVLTFTPFICCFARKAGIDAVPYLFAEFFAANTWSTLLIIGNPTNIYLATGAGVDFWSYLSVMWLPALFAGVTSFALLFLIFRKRLLSEMNACFEKSVKIERKTPVIIGVLHLAVCIVALAVSDLLGLEMWLITCLLAASLVLCSLAYFLITRSSPAVLFRAVKRLPYSLVPFVLSMFIVVLALQKTGVTDALAQIFSGVNVVFGVGITSFFVANLINNIPMSVFYGSILGSSAFNPASALRGVFAAVIGSNLGAYFTPIGALAGIMWLSILKKQEVKITFSQFTKYGALVSVPSLIAALLGLCLALG